MIKKLTKLSAMEKGAVGFIQWGTFLVIALVTAFGDAMFIKIMWGYFPDGFLRYLAVGGACTTALSIILLVLGKERWFRPGPQLLSAWGFTVVEVVISIFNVMCASGNTAMYWWLAFSPATPFASLVGWIIVRMLDPNVKQRHMQMEMEDEIMESNLAFEKAQHDAQMEIRYKALEQNKQYMIEALENPAHQKVIAVGADKLTARTIQQVLGISVPQQENTQNQTNLASLAQTGNTDTLSISRKDFDALVQRVNDKSPS